MPTPFVDSTIALMLSRAPPSTRVGLLDRRAVIADERHFGPGGVLRRRTIGLPPTSGATPKDGCLKNSLTSIE
jgi:hypothetical protein